MTEGKRTRRPPHERIAEQLQNVPVMRDVVTELVRADRECAGLLRDKLDAALRAPDPENASEAP